LAFPGLYGVIENALSELLSSSISGLSGERGFQLVLHKLRLKVNRSKSAAVSRPSATNKACLRESSARD